MKDPKTPLQTEYFGLLDGNISYGGNTIPVYDVVPDDETYPYIQFGESTDNDDSTKTTFGSNNTLGLSIVDRYASGHTGSRIRINDIAEQIFEIIRVRPVTLSPTGFKVISVTIDNDIFLRELSDTHLYMRREIRFRHLLEQTA